MLYLAKDICEIPAEVGECTNYEPMWYYDTKDQRCRQFYYGGCGGNENKFTSEEACLQRCEKKPEPEPEPQPQPQPVPERTPETIQPSGDINVCKEKPDQGDCRNFTLLWHYDTEYSDCRQFYYGGCGGNGNRFSSKEDCEHQCKEEPAPILPELPSEENICLLPEDTGDCDDYKQFWYFDSLTSRCSQFFYGGCGGNGNRFASEEECMTRCGPEPEFETRIEVNKCFLPVSTGNCLGYEVRWYYNSVDGVCDKFVYTGCDGNENNYASEDECENECFPVQKTCELPPLRGNCNESMIRWHFIQETGSCSEFEFTGCRGNRNNFVTEQECMSSCGRGELPPPTYSVCDQPLDAGECDNSTTAWYYDNEAMICVAFTYTGCGGNGNRFLTREQCERQCGEYKGVEPDITNEVLPNRCESYEDECNRISCPYGVRRIPVDEECQRCECINPCSDHQCNDGYQCAIEVSSNVPGQFVPVCRLINKPGFCPQLTAYDSACARECYTDADCRDDNKCCSSGCGFVCVRPTPPTVRTTAPTTAAPVVVYPGEVRASLVPKQKSELDVNTPMGGIAVLRCFATGNPAPNVTWSRNNVMVDTNQGRYVLTSSGDLTIVQVRQTDSGSYVCVASNGLGEPVRREVELQVTVPVSAVIGMDPNNNYTPGSTIAMGCSVQGYPKPNVTWIKDGIPLLASERIQISVGEPYRLVINNISPTDSGKYGCKAANAVSYSISEESVTVESTIPINPECIDNEHFANCKLIVKGRYCKNKYYARFCCRSCALAGQL